MADIVLGFGSSHGPTIGTPPERWHLLGEKDMEDSRFDFESLLKNPRPGIEKELTLDVFRERHAALQRAIDTLNQVLMDARPDVVVVLSNPHGSVPMDTPQPTFGVYINDTPPTDGPTVTPARGRGAPVDAPFEEKAERFIPKYPTDGDLAHHLMTGLIEERIDVAAYFQSEPGRGLDGAFNLLYQRFDTTAALPYVPILISRYLPNQATPKRCYEFGQALRRTIESWDSDKRVAVMASGGLSHQIIDPELDQMVIDALQKGDADVLTALDRTRLNGAPGTPEILNWVTAAAVMEPKTMSLVDYVPCYRSRAGTGHGVALGYW